MCDQFFTCLNIGRYKLLTIITQREATLQRPYQIRHFTRLYSVTTGRQCNGLGGVFALLVLLLLLRFFGIVLFSETYKKCITPKPVRY